jgi:1-deoxy-D-xylulose-5-phosphate synthase
MVAADHLNATLVDMRWVKPVDEAMTLKVAAQHELLVTLEENAVAGGAGSAVNELLAVNGQHCALLNLGLPDHPVEHGSHGEQLAWTGLNNESIRERIEHALSPQKAPSMPDVRIRDVVEMPRQVP